MVLTLQGCLVQWSEQQLVAHFVAAVGVIVAAEAVVDAAKQMKRDLVTSVMYVQSERKE